MAGGTALDVVYVNFRKLGSYVSQGFLYPLNEYCNKDPQVLNEVKPSIRHVLNIDGKIYCIPWAQYAMALYYRKDLYKEAGLDPNKPPRTWDQFYDYCKKLTVPEKGQYGFGFASYPQGTPYHWVNFVWQAGGNVVTKDKRGDWYAAFDTPEGVTALDFYKKLVAGKWVRPSDGMVIRGVASRTNTWKDDCTQGKIAQWFSDTSDSIARKPEVDPDLLGMAELPAGPAGKACTINAAMWAMNSQIKEKRVRDAAWEFIKFMSGEEAHKIRVTAYVEAGLAKLVNPDKLTEYGYTEYTRGIRKGWGAEIEDSFKHGVPEPYGKNCELLYTEMDYPLEAAYLNPKIDSTKVLKDCADKINTKMLGYIPPGVMEHKRRVAWIVFALLFAGIGTIAAVQMKRLARAHVDEGDDAQVVRTGARIHIVAWLFMLPAVASILIWSYYPLFRGMIMAFQDYKILGHSSFVGLDNFISAVGQDTFWIGIGNSLVYTALNLALGFLLPVLLALMLNEVPRGKMLYRTIYYLPAVTSGLVIIFLWKWFYDPSPTGLFNSVIGYYNDIAMTLAAHIHPSLAHMKLSTQTWLADPKLAMLCVVLPSIWAGAGPGSIIYLAAMKGIPDEMYEAADLDGAGIWSKIWRITIPSLKPLLVINFVGAFIGSFKAMENIFVLTGGGPLNHTHTIGLEIWYNAFLYLRFGYATAAAWIMGSMLVGFTMYQLRILKNVRFSTTGREDN
jgi:multiple sugar transport system permease protein